MKPDRLPVGAPQALDKDGKLLLMYGIDKNGKLHSDWAFTDIDAAPTKSFIVTNWKDKNIRPYFDCAVAKRPEWEFFNLKNDPLCLNNLAGKEQFGKIEKEMKKKLISELRQTKDPRVVGPNKEIFDSYKRYSPMRYFPKPS